MGDKLTSIKLVCQVPKGEHIVSMITHKADVYVATNNYVYRLVKDELKKVDFVHVSDDGS